MKKNKKNNGFNSQGVRDLGYSSKSKVKHLPEECSHINMQQDSSDFEKMYCPDCQLSID